VTACGPVSAGAEVGSLAGMDSQFVELLVVAEIDSELRRRGHSSGSMPVTDHVNALLDLRNLVTVAVARAAPADEPPPASRHKVRPRLRANAP
jgi:hypothetical protein